MISKKTYIKMKKLVEEFENPKPTSQIEPPYLIQFKTRESRKYNPKYGDDRECKCGHSYYRHFDSYERMQNVGCKYCQCCNFTEKVDGDEEE